jgi:hypothetical protein
MSTLFRAATAAVAASGTWPSARRPADRSDRPAGDSAKVTGAFRAPRFLLLLGGTALAGLMPFTGAQAQSQEVASEYFKRDRSISVAQRPQPEFGPLGIPAGGFIVYPQLTLSTAYDDNIYASRIGEADDVIFDIQPEARIQSRWSRHSLQLRGFADIKRFAEHSSENTENWEVAGVGRLDTSRANRVNIEASIARRTQERTSPESAVFTTEPIRFLYKHAEVRGEQEFNRVMLSLLGRWQDYNYNNTEVPGGIFNQDDRDRRVLTGIGTVDFALGPRIALFVEGRYNDRKYAEEAAVSQFPVRDSTGYEVLAGVDFELTDFLRGVVGAGYLSQDYDSPFYEDFSGWSADGRLEWFPTLLTTVTARLRRDVGDSGIVGAGGYLTTSGSVRVDHELLRNLQLQAEGGFYRFKYQDLDRDDRRWYVQAGATFQLNRRYGARLDLIHEDQDTHGTDFGQVYTINRVTASIFVRI